MNFINSFFGGGGGEQGHYGHHQEYNQGPPQYQNFLRAYPASFLGRSDLEEGNKILLPASVLEELTRGAMPQPLIFRINSMASKKTFYVGVLEFVAPEDIVVLPLWV